MNIDKGKDLWAFCYISSVSEGIGAEEIRKLQAGAKQRNKEHQITGILFYGMDSFFQYVEGPKNEIFQLRENILFDKRHYGVITVCFKEIPKRLYENWDLKPGEISCQSFLDAIAESEISTSPFQAFSRLEKIYPSLSSFS